jgi:hypothetical protein
MGLFTPAWKSKNKKRALRAVGKMTDQEKLGRVAKEAYCREARVPAVEKLADPAVLAYIAKNDSDSSVRLAAVKRVTDPAVLADIAKNDSDSDVCIAAAHKLVEFDLEEDLLTDLIRMLGNALKKSENEGTTRNAANTLLAFYRRYGTSKHGQEIRGYEGTHSGGYSTHSDSHYDNRNSYLSYSDSGCSSLSGMGGCSSDNVHMDSHTDEHTDTSFSVTFNPGED